MPSNSSECPRFQRPVGLCVLTRTGLAEGVIILSKRRSVSLLLSASALSGLFALIAAPASAAFAADPPHLVVYGPSGTLSVGANTAVSASVAGATGIPYYQFRVNQRIVQRYSANDRLNLTGLAAGPYSVTVRSLGKGQVKRGQWKLFRSKTLHFMVGSPHLTVQGPPATVATDQSAVIHAAVVDAFKTPYFQFSVNGTVVQSFSAQSTFSLNHLKPGHYTILVESLGPGQYLKRQFSAARKAVVHFFVPTPPPTAHPVLSVSSSQVAPGTADTITAAGIPSGTAVTWSVINSNTATGLISGQGDSATFVGTAPGVYMVQASADGATATAKIVVYGSAAGVTLSPASSTVVGDGEAMDAVTANIVDAVGNLVSNFNGTITLNAVASVTYEQGGQVLPVNNGTVTVTVTSGTATFAVGQIGVPGMTVALTPSHLVSTNGQAVANTPIYSATTISSSAQVATSLKFANLPQDLYANTAVASPLIAVIVEDQAGYPMLTGNDTVDVSASGPATLVNASNNQNQLTLAYNGFEVPAGVLNPSAEFQVQSVQGSTGTITLTASAAGLTPATGTIQAVIAGVPSQMSASLSTSTFAEGSSGTTLQLQAEDANGVPVGDSSAVVVTVTPSGSTSAADNILVNGTPGSAEVGLSPSTGSGSVTLTDNGSGAHAGTYTVTVAPASGATVSFPAQTLTFTETAASMAGVTFVSPSSTINVPIGNPTAPYQLQLVDRFGNPVAKAGVQVQVYAVGHSTTGQSYGQATVNGASTSASSPVTLTTDANGQATATLTAEQYAGADWQLVATVPVQSGVASALQSAPSADMAVSSEIPARVGVSLEDITAGADFQSAGYAVAGDNVNATLTFTNQYGTPMTGTQTVTLAIPPGFSGYEPPNATDSSPWVQGASDTVTMTLVLAGNGQATVPLRAWTEGPANLTASLSGLVTPVSGSATMVVQPGPAIGLGMFQNGSEVTTGHPVTVSANQPVALTVQPTDIAGNPVTASASEVVTFTNLDGGTVRPTPSGAGLSTVTIPAGQNAVQVYYVNGTSGSYVPQPVLAAQNVAPTSSAYSTTPGASTTITVRVTGAGGQLVSGQTVTAAVPGGEGTVTTSAVTNASGTANFTYTAPTSASGTETAAITFSIPGTGVTQTVSVTY